MKNKLAAVLVLSVIFVSCQKEISVDTPGNTGSNGGGGSKGLLIKSVSVTDGDTLTTLYAYDGQKRLETQTMDGTSGGMTFHSYKKFERDGAGRISRIVQVVAQGGVQSDTTINTPHYPNTSTLNYDYTLENFSLGGFSVMDSSLYNYTNGKMMRVSSYMTSPLFGPVAMQISRFDFSYDASGRISSMKMYSSGTTPGTPLAPLANQTYTYGQALDALWTTNNGAQNYLLGGMPNANNDIVVKLQMEDLTGANPLVNTIVTTTYVLDSENKLVSTTTTSAGAQISVTKTNYYYQ